MDTALSPQFVALTVRLLCFAGVLSLLPRRIVPGTVRIALAVALILFFLPAVSLTESGSGEYSSDLGWNLVYISRTFESLALSGSLSKTVSFGSLSFLVVEAMLGLLLGIAASVGAYAAKLVSVWFSGVLFGPADIELSPQKACQAMEGLVLLLFLYTLFVLPGFHRVWAFVGASISLFPWAGPQPVLSTGALFKLVAQTGSVAVLVAGIVALPVLFSSLFVDFSFFLYRRYFSQAFSEHLVRGSRAPILVLVIMLGLYTLSRNFGVLLEQSLDDDRAKTIIVPED